MPRFGASLVPIENIRKIRVLVQHLKQVFGYWSFTVGVAGVIISACLALAPGPRVVRPMHATLRKGLR